MNDQETIRGLPTIICPHCGSYNVSKRWNLSRIGKFLRKDRWDCHLCMRWFNKQKEIKDD